MTLILVRHGQASFGAADYDVLSSLGAEQSRRLGAWMAETRFAVDAAFVGPLRRQRETLQHLGAAALAGGVELPEAEVDDDLREYPAHAIVQHFAPTVGAGDPALGQLLAVNGGGGVREPLVEPARVQRLFEDIMYRWGHGELYAPHLERFADFVARVRAALWRIAARVGRGRALVVTSGGPVAAATALSLGLGVVETLRLSWVLSNASVTELRFRDDALALWRFNSIAHLPAPELVTYR